MAAAIRRALISVHDKTGAIDLARALTAHGATILSTGGTAAHLSAAGIAVVPVSTVTGFPEILDGRVKTLHPAIFGGLLADPDNPRHHDDLQANGITAIDLVAVNLYPFESTIADPRATLEQAIEKIDVGGPAMIRAAAKNHRHTIVLTDPNDYAAFVAELDSGEISFATRQRLAAKAFVRTAAYDAAIAAYFDRLIATPTTASDGTASDATASDGTASDARASALPESLRIDLTRVQTLRYGENPHQRAALYRDGEDARAGRQIAGKELSFNNLLDLDAAWRLARELPAPGVAIIKHTNPCGAAYGASVTEAFSLARACDPLSAFGGVIAVNSEVGAEAAAKILENFVEAVIAPAFTPEAERVFARKANVRLLVAPNSPAGPESLDMKRIAGGYLVQDWDRPLRGRADWKVIGGRTPSASEWTALEFAWTVCRHVKSNAIVFAHPGQTAGIGAGQMSRVDSCRIATAKAQLPLAGTVAASDGFFPFRDGIDAIAAAGATALIQPGGSQRDSEVIAAANEHGLAMVFTHERHFRH